MENRLIRSSLLVKEKGGYWRFIGHVTTTQFSRHLNDYKDKDMDLREYLESHGTKLSILNPNKNKRYMRAFKEDSKYFKSHIKNKVISPKRVLLSEVKIDESKIDDMNLSEMLLVIRHFPAWAASDTKEGSASFKIRSKLIDKIIDLVRMAWKLADERFINEDIRREDERLLSWDLARPILDHADMLRKYITINKVKALQSETDKKIREWEAETARLEQLEREATARVKELNQKKLEYLKEQYLHIEDIDKYVKEALKGVYSIGMPAEFLEIIFPDEYPGANKKESVTKDKVSFSVQYEYLRKTSHGNSKYKKEFSVENDLIVGWRDIN